MKETNIGLYFLDINECAASLHDCDVSISDCVNDVPSFHCECHDFYTMVEGDCQG